MPLDGALPELTPGKGTGPVPSSSQIKTGHRPPSINDGHGPAPGVRTNG